MTLRRTSVFVAMTLCVALSSACGDDERPSADAAEDAPAADTSPTDGGDSGSDADSDGGESDGGTDAGDSGPDAETDAADGGADGGSDAASDGGSDAASDADAGSDAGDDSSADADDAATDSGPDATDSGSGCEVRIEDRVAGVCDGIGMRICSEWASENAGGTAVAQCVPPEGRCARANSCTDGRCTCGEEAECADNQMCVSGFAGFTCICIPPPE